MDRWLKMRLIVLPHPFLVLGIALLLASCDADSIIKGKLVAEDPESIPENPEIVLPVVQFSTGSQSVSESGGTATITVEIDSVSPVETTIPVSVVGTSTATEGAGSDYTLSATSVSIPAGQTTGTLTVTVNNDSSDESPDEWIDFALGTPTYATLGSQVTQQLTITDDDPFSVNVTATYPTHSNWNDYVKNNNGGSNDYDQPDSDCVGNETGGYSACIHGGEKRKVVITGYSSCTGLTLAESLNAFNWLCRVDAGTATFHTASLKLTAGLGDLINSDRTWKNNSVSISYQGNVIATSGSTAWWTNNLVAPPADVGSPVVISGANGYASGDVIVINSNLSHSGFNINLDKLAMVVLPGYTLSFFGSAGCVWPTGENKDGGFEENCMFAAGSQKFLWIEGSVNGSGAGGDLDFGVLFNNVVFSRINRYYQRLGDDTGIGFNTANNNKMTGVRVENFGGWSNVWFEGSSYNLGIDLTMAQSNHGLNLQLGSNNNTFVNAKAYNTYDNSNNFNVDASTDNTFIGVMSASSGNAGMHVKNGSDRTTVSHYFSAHESDESVYMGADDMTLNQAVIVNNGDNFGGIYADQNNPLISQIVVANGNDNGLDWVASDGRATNNILIGNTALASCSVSGGTNPGVLDGGCGNDGTSDANWLVGFSVNLANSFSGKLTSDDSVNTSDVTGLLAYSATSIDWLLFANPFRMWSRDGSSGFNLDQTDTCNSGDCRIWDWRLSSSDSVIRNKSGDGSSNNEAFVAGSTCPTAVHGNRALTDQHSPPRTFLVNATEIMADGVGNDNGLCESNEACIYSPNFGYYQGEGDYLVAGTCTFQNGTVTGVSIYANPTNGF